MERNLKKIFDQFLVCANFDAEVDLDPDEEEAYNRILTNCGFADSDIFALDVPECYSTLNFNVANGLAELINIVLSHCHDICNMDIVYNLVTIYYARNLTGNEEFCFLLGYALYCVANNWNYYMFDIVFGKLKSEIEDKPEAIQL